MTTYTAEQMALILRTTLTRMQHIVDGAVAGGNLGDPEMQCSIRDDLHLEIEMTMLPEALAIAQAEQEAGHV